MQWIWIKHLKDTYLCWFLQNSTSWKQSVQDSDKDKNSFFFFLFFFTGLILCVFKQLFFFLSYPLDIFMADKIHSKGNKQRFWSFDVPQDQGHLEGWTWPHLWHPTEAWWVWSRWSSSQPCSRHLPSGTWPTAWPCGSNEAAPQETQLSLFPWSHPGFPLLWQSMWCVCWLAWKHSCDHGYVQ